MRAAPGDVRLHERSVWLIGWVRDYASGGARGLRTDRTGAGASGTAPASGTGATTTVPKIGSSGTRTNAISSEAADITPATRMPRMQTKAMIRRKPFTLSIS